LALSGALMALLIGATVLSLVFRLFGTDRWIAEQIQASTLSPSVTAALVLVAVALCAWVLDAFEMIFVVIPIVAPTLIALLGDAQQVAVLLLMVLQLSFLVPPMGYAVLMARASAHQPVHFAPLARAIAPFVGVQLLVLAGVFLLPQTVHQLDATAVPVVVDSEQDIEQQMKEMSAALPESKP
jgi:TRAP-type mannitol/chloroaromatic compound transport system permease large subunit